LEAIHDVLGDAEQDFGTSKPAANGAARGSKGVPEFTHFKFGDEDLGEEQGATQTPAALKERLEIANKLAAMQAARKKQRQSSQAPAVEVRSGSKHQRSTSLSSARGRSAFNPVNGIGGGSDEDEDNDGDDAGDAAEEGGNKEPTIQWKHVLASLQQTRASISPQERRRLEKIYREFVWGRSGEMPNGQGGTEVGGRTSLM